jgi:2-polyprenyl-3-methyl-5-hydroxy-6-metoxy-1,4-benzoquinol methylase
MANYRKWDEIYRLYPIEKLGWELGKPRPILVKYLQNGLLPKGRVLDICCGIGTNTVYLAQNGFEVTGIDISPTAVGIAKQKAKAATVSINFLVESFLYLTFKDGEFDFVWDMGCFHHVVEIERDSFIQEIYRVLSDDGEYMLTCFSDRNGQAWNYFSRQKIIDLFSDLFEFGKFLDYSSLEGDGVTRFFFTVLMKKKAVI